MLYPIVSKLTRKLHENIVTNDTVYIQILTKQHQKSSANAAGFLRTKINIYRAIIMASI
jgi:hypothetical protein